MITKETHPKLMARQSAWWKEYEAKNKGQHWLDKLSPSTRKEVEEHNKSHPDSPEIARIREYLNSK